MILCFKPSSSVSKETDGLKKDLGQQGLVMVSEKITLARNVVEVKSSAGIRGIGER